MSNRSGGCTSASPSVSIACVTGLVFACYYPQRVGAMKLIDVTVPLDADLPAYPGNTPFNIEPIKRIARGDSSNVSTLHLSAHTGTHVDAPRHFFDEGSGVEALP